MKNIQQSLMYVTAWRDGQLCVYLEEMVFLGLVPPRGIVE